MSSADIEHYFDTTTQRNIRDDLKFAVSEIGEPKIAIDCGCGAGADIEYLTQNNFKVYGFDIEPSSIARCQSRFSNYDNVVLSQSSFSEFDYPKVSLVVADASLFFCPTVDFDTVWEKIYQCLLPGGIFCGSLLGIEDTMAKPNDRLGDNSGAINPSVLWPHVTAFEEQDVKKLLARYQVMRFNTHQSSGLNSQGLEHNWHIFQIVARKPQKV